MRIHDDVNVNQFSEPEIPVPAHLLRGMAIHGQNDQSVRRSAAYLLPAQEDPRERLHR